MMEQLGSQIQVSRTLYNDHVVTLPSAFVRHICLLLQALEAQISQEENSSQALREEVLSKEQNVLELHTAMKQVRLSNLKYLH